MTVAIDWSTCSRIARAAKLGDNTDHCKKWSRGANKAAGLGGGVCGGVGVGGGQMLLTACTKPAAAAKLVANTMLIFFGRLKGQGRGGGGGSGRQTFLVGWHQNSIG